MLSRASSTLLFAVALMVVVPFCGTVVLGVDFGSEFYKISLIKPGKAFEMVENLNSKTNTYNVLSFFDNRRLKEYEAYTRVLRVPHNSFFMLNKYIGRPRDDPLLTKLRSIHYDDYKLVDLETGDVAFEIKDFLLPASIDGKVIDRLEGKTQLTLEEVIGMILEHARLITKTFAGSEVKDAYFSVPPWWGPAERKTLYSIAKLAGLNPQGFSSENTGTATYYSINRNKESLNETILFFNVGSMSTKTSIFKFEKVLDKNNDTQESYTLLSEAWDQEAGGYAVDICLANHFATEFDAKSGKDSIKSNVRVMRRLIREALKVKEILSANKEASFIVEEVYQGLDFSRKYTREDFETLCREPIEKSVQTISVALERAGITAENLDAIQILGGASRIPLSHTLIKEKFNKEHSMNLNGDNSMAMGISFMAANSSTQFKAKKLFLTHGPAYSTHVVVKEKGTGVELNSTTIFEPFNSYNARHIMQLENIPQQDLDVEIETIPLEGSHTPKRDNFKMRYSVTGIDDFLKNETLKDRINATLRFGFMVDSYGLPGLGFSDIVYLLEVEEKKPKSSRTNSTNDTETEEKKEEEETIKVRSANPDN